jgi:hypothetical protein
MFSLAIRKRVAPRAFQQTWDSLLSIPARYAQLIYLLPFTFFLLSLEFANMLLTISELLHPAPAD